MRTLSILAAAAALGAAAPAFAAASPIGEWKTPTGQVEIYNCGAQLCGKVTGSPRLVSEPNLRDEKNKDPALRSRKLMGLNVLFGFSGGPTVWKGKAYKPQDGNTYSGTMTLLDDNTLKVRGCVVFPLCETQTWTRLK